MKFQRICIGSCPSSGSTLFADYLDSIKGVLCGPELNIYCADAFYKFDERFKLAFKQRRTFITNSIYSPFTRFFNSKHNANIGVTDEKILELVLESDSLVSFIEKLADVFARFRGKEVDIIAEKTPINIGYIGKFLEQFPNDIFVVVVRNPYDVILSLHRRGYSYLEAALIWIYQNSLAKKYLDNPRVKFVKFENFLQAPFRELSNVLLCLDSSYTEEFVKENYSPSNYRSGLERVSTWTHSSTIIEKKENYTEVFPKNLIGSLARLEFAIGDSRYSFPDICKALGYGTELISSAEESSIFDTGYKIFKEDDSSPINLIKFGNERLSSEVRESTKIIFNPNTVDIDNLSLQQPSSSVAEHILLGGYPHTLSYKIRKTAAVIDRGLNDVFSERMLNVLFTIQYDWIKRRIVTNKELLSNDISTIEKIFQLLPPDYCSYTQKMWAHIKSKNGVIGKGSASGTVENQIDELIDNINQTDRDIFLGFICNHLNFDNGLFYQNKQHSKLLLTPKIALLLASIIKRYFKFEPYANSVRLPLYNQGIGLAGISAETIKQNFLNGLYSPPRLSEIYDPSVINTHVIDTVCDLENTLRDGLEAIKKKEFSIPISQITGSDLIVSLRNDVDRPLTDKQVQKQILINDMVGSPSSWYFKPETFDENYVEFIHNNGCEIGYHCSRHFDGDYGFVQKLFNPKYEVTGSTFHGGFASFYSNGVDSISNISKLGFDYTENVASVYKYPYSLSIDGRLIYLTPSSVKPQSHPTTVKRHIDRVGKAGFLIIENHPDLDFSFAQNVIENLLRRGAIFCTVKRQIDYVKQYENLLRRIDIKYESGTVRITNNNNHDILVSGQGANGDQIFVMPNQTITI